MTERPQSAVASDSDFVADRLKQLSTSDPAFHAALADPAVERAKLNPKLGLAEIIELVMTAYADRPALAQRATEFVVDSGSGRTTRRLLDEWDMISYRALWSRTRHLAGFWYHDAARRLRADDRICIIAFAGLDFATVDLAALHNGAVVVPMQTSAPLPQLLEIIKEVEPEWLATNFECLNTSVELVLGGHRPKGLLLFDYHPEVDDEREMFEAARARLAAAGLPDLMLTLAEACAQGELMPQAPIFTASDADKRLCTIYYTSGSTGSPKGAMRSASMIKKSWQTLAAIPYFYMHYLPMSHAFGRSGLFYTLSFGGTCYFTAKSDLSLLFEDLRTVRPTFMAVVPRICEMVFQQYRTELERRSTEVADLDVLERELILEVRESILGGRLLGVSFGSAPLAPELRQFMEACLGFKFDDWYGLTEAPLLIRNNVVMKPPVVDYKLVDVPELGYFTTDKPHPRGELLVKTSNIMMGYYKRPEVTASVFDSEGYYKTGDIMAQTGPDQLVYVDRRNNVLKLAQGEFIAISRLETLFSNGHPLIHQAYLYGTSERSFLVGVFVPNETALSAARIDPKDWKAIKAAVRGAIKDVARTEQLNAYEVPRDFIVENEPFSVANGLLAGIGKYQRPKFKQRYGARLEQLYDDIAGNQSDELQRLRREGRTAPVLQTITRAIQATLGIDAIDLSQACSFSDLGGDSLSALSCSLLLEEIYEIEVPASVINNPAGSLQQLAQFIERARAGAQRPTFASVHGRGATEIRTSDLKLKKFLDAQTLTAAKQAGAPQTDYRTVLITGANGYLGRFLCLEWLQRMAKVGGRVICIARGQDTASARQRIARAFESGDAKLKIHFEALAAKHLEVLAGDLSEAELGLVHADWQRLAKDVDVIVHPAAFVNHVLPYSQLFGPNVVGTAELIRLAITRRVKPFINVSTVAAARIPSGGVIDEDADLRVITPTRTLEAGTYAAGYANSKWAGEVLLREAHEHFGLPVSVFRCDMILAHRRYKGQINVPDMFTRWLFSIVVTGLAPRSFYVSGAQRPHYDGLPVDFTAEVITTLGAEVKRGYHTYHVVNPHDDAISMDSFVDWIIDAGYAIARIDDYAEWCNRFETALRGLPEKQRQHSSLPLLHQLRMPLQGHKGVTVPSARFRADLRVHAIEIPHLSAAFVRKYLEDLRIVGLI